MNEIFYVFESIMRVSRSDERCLYVYIIMIHLSMLAYYVINVLWGVLRTLSKCSKHFAYKVKVWQYQFMLMILVLYNINVWFDCRFAYMCVCQCIHLFLANNLFRFVVSFECRPNENVFHIRISNLPYLCLLFNFWIKR